MEPMVWQGNWEMGETRLDGQHRAMVRAINLLATRLQEGRPREGVNRSITFLMIYAELHFREEEAAMEACGYPELSVHVAQHRECSRRIEDMLAKWREGDSGLLTEVIAFFNYWLTEHLGNADRRFSEYLRRPA
ncbi:bacteriohemerythrin [Mesoterricola silvestris]|uniref:Hemerythrin n=1 Tax=Mesoterricola silvestris TaxID=2927979 RepID=A0AA48K8J3_9BACT|nr:hemerythrin family protein [Mesoterricola silvestris]BDU72979.1 hemerythrin [Mesoterricola silvestris]